MSQRLPMPNLRTATAEEIIRYEKRRAMTEEQYNRELRFAFLSGRLETVVEKLVAQRNKLQQEVSS